jgi:Kef-type K+ transport system membrane component KefB
MTKYRTRKYGFYLLVSALSLLPFFIANASGGEGSGGHTVDIASTLLWIAVLLIAAKLGGMVEKLGQPSVLGELVIGVIIGNLALLGITFFNPIKADQFLPFLAELGVIILLFQVGLESNISQMKKVGPRAFLVATVGVVVPFVLGTYIVGPWLFPGLATTAYLFLGASLTATSVGITARVFKDLNKLKTPEAQIVLGAAVIDDVMGLIILAVVSAIATMGSVGLGTIFFIFIKALVFLVGAIVLGQFSAPYLGKWFSKIHTGIAMKFTLAISFALIFAWAAGEIGLAPIVGAFAAGLVLDPTHFKCFNKPKMAEELIASAEKIEGESKKSFCDMAERYCEKHVEDLIEPLAHFLVPIFFVLTGMSVNLETLFDVKILIVALGITVVAILGKYVSGFVAGKVNKNIVGFGMVPRGEVGLIFASIGIGLGVISQQLFSVIVIMVIFTTLLTPPILAYFIKKQN